MILFISWNSNCDNHFVKTTSENRLFKNLWELATFKTTKFHFSWIFENWGDY